MVTIDADPPALVPELDVTDLDASMRFYALLGFRTAYERPDEAFASLALGRAHLLLQAAEGPGRRFRTAPLTRPFGRGVNLQIEVDDIDAVHERVTAAGHRLVLDIEERWYRTADAEVGNRQFVVPDPDGYLIRPFQDLGARG